jgi:hypothetical protein
MLLKRIIFIFFFPFFLFAESNVNINLSLPAPQSKSNYKKLPQYGVNNTGEIKNINKSSPVDKNSNVSERNIKKMVIRKTGITAGSVKIIKNDVIDNGSKEGSICSAFVSENSDKAFDKGYKEGIKYTKIYIGKFLLKHKKSLDILFPIKQLYLNGGILQPPLIVKSIGDSFTYENGDVYRQYGVKYIIKEPAKFVTKNSYKKWEDFLLDYPVSYYKNAKINDVLNFSFNIRYSDNDKCNELIRKTVYKKFREGFLAGENEVFLLMETRLKKLENFLNGLYLYNELYYRGIVNPPLISEFIEPVYKNKNGQSLVINEKILKIVKLAEFNTETKKWKVFLITNDKITTVHFNYKH